MKRWKKKRQTSVVLCPYTTEHNCVVARRSSVGNCNIFGAVLFFLSVGQKLLKCWSLNFHVPILLFKMCNRSLCFTEDFNWMHRSLLRLGLGQQGTNAPAVLRGFLSTSLSEAQCSPRAFSFPNTGLVQGDRQYLASSSVFSLRMLHTCFDGIC